VDSRGLVRLSSECTAIGPTATATQEVRRALARVTGETGGYSGSRGVPFKGLVGARQAALACAAAQLAATRGSHKASWGQIERMTTITIIVITKGEAPMMTSSILPRRLKPCTT
jgi:hypothetical protein